MVFMVVPGYPGVTSPKSFRSATPKQVRWQLRYQHYISCSRSIRILGHYASFLDFEASLLSKHSYPIEIIWVFEWRSRTFLIKPAPGWTDWSAEAEAIHGISPEFLQREGAGIADIV